MNPRILGGQVAAPGLHRSLEAPPVGEDDGDDGTGRELRQPDVEPVAAAAGRLQQDELAADRVDRDLHAAVVVDVGGREPASVQQQALRPEDPVRVAESLQPSAVRRAR